MNKSLPENNEILIPDELVMNQIYQIRGQKVMLDRDLAKLYGVETRALNQAVKRNLTSFPDDFMFELNTKEFDSLRSQIVTLKNKGTHTKYPPSAFPEQGALIKNITKVS